MLAIHTRALGLFVWWDPGPNIFAFTAEIFLEMVSPVWRNSYE